MFSVLRHCFRTLFRSPPLHTSLSGSSSIIAHWLYYMNTLLALETGHQLAIITPVWTRLHCVFRISLLASLITEIYLGKVNCALCPRVKALRLTAAANCQPVNSARSRISLVRSRTSLVASCSRPALLCSGIAPARPRETRITVVTPSTVFNFLYSNQERTD